jgi:hypothetical protein
MQATNDVGEEGMTSSYIGPGELPLEKVM